MKEIKTDGINPIVESSEDKAHLVARGVIAAIPMLGGTALELFSALLEPPLEKRKREWMIEISEVVNNLQKNYELDIEALVHDEQFISILLATSQKAVLTHKKEKLARLKNVLVNSAVKKVDYDVSMLFLSYLDTLSEFHIRMLDLIVQNQMKIETENALTYDDCERYIETETYPEDLTIAGYMRSQLEDMHFLDSRMVNNKGYMILSEHGDKFYKFISQ